MAYDVTQAPRPYMQVGNWRPFKGTPDKQPTDPPPLGRSPVGGYSNPRFPSTWARDVSPPAGGYQSIINAAAPFNASQRSRLASTPASFRSYGSGAGNASRSAFSGALAGLSSNAVAKAADQVETDYRRQAEKSRSEDILAQRQNAHDRYRMDVFKNIFDTDTDARYSEGIKDLRQKWYTEKQNENAKQTAMWLSFIGGLI